MTRELLEDLRSYVATLPTGAVTDPGKIAELLAPVWHLFDGSGEHSMYGSKLKRRIEQVHWERPVLTFAIERHGGTVLGSTRAEIQKWEVNLETRRAAVSQAGQRQVHPARRALKVEPVAKKLASSIRAHRNSRFLRWIVRGQRVQVLTGSIPGLSDGPEQTVLGRRKRFHRVLEDLLAPDGWTRRPNQSIYEIGTASPGMSIDKPQRP